MVALGGISSSGLVRGHYRVCDGSVLVVSVWWGKLMYPSPYPLLSSLPSASLPYLLLTSWSEADYIKLQIQHAAT